LNISQLKLRSEKFDDDDDDDDDDDNNNNNTPKSKVLLEKLTGSRLVKVFPTFYGTEVSLQHSQLPGT
jgi:hypothetical protein